MGYFALVTVVAVGFNCRLVKNKTPLQQFAWTSCIAEPHLITNQGQQMTLTVRTVYSIFMSLPVHINDAVRININSYLNGASHKIIAA